MHFRYDVYITPGMKSFFHVKTLLKYTFEINYSSTRFKTEHTFESRQ